MQLDFLFFFFLTILLNKFTDHKVVHFLYLLTMKLWTSYSPVVLIHWNSRKFIEIIAQIKINNFVPNILVSTIFSSCNRKKISFIHTKRERDSEACVCEKRTHRYRVDACFYTLVCKPVRTPFWIPQFIFGRFIQLQVHVNREWTNWLNDGLNGNCWYEWNWKYTVIVSPMRHRFIVAPQVLAIYFIRENSISFVHVVKHILWIKLPIQEDKTKKAVSASCFS